LSCCGIRCASSSSSLPMGLIHRNLPLRVALCADSAYNKASMLILLIAHPCAHCSGRPRAYSRNTPKMRPKTLGTPQGSYTTCFLLPHGHIRPKAPHFLCGCRFQNVFTFHSAPSGRLRHGHRWPGLLFVVPRERCQPLALQGTSLRGFQQERRGSGESPIRGKGTYRASGRNPLWDFVT